MPVATYAETPRIGDGTPANPYRPNIACTHDGSRWTTQKNDNGTTFYVYFDCPTCAALADATSMPAATWSGTRATSRTRWGL